MNAIPPPRRWRGRPVARGLPAELWRWALVAAITVPLLVGVAVAGVAFAVYRQARQGQLVPADAIVVMGAAQYNGRPSPVLRSRLDTALDAYERGLAPVVIVTGGNQAGDAYTEAGTGRDYLVDRGVPSDAVLVEDRSTNTAENLRNAAAIARDEGIRSVLIVSDGFHLFRSKMIARALGLDAAGIPAENSPIRAGSASERGYILRETAAILAYKLL